MSEKKHLNEQDLQKVSGGIEKYQESWHVLEIYKNEFCSTCNKVVDMVVYKEAVNSGYCAICHRFLCGLD